METRTATQQHGSSSGSGMPAGCPPEASERQLGGNPAATQQQSGGQPAAEQQHAGYLVSEAAERLEIPERTLRAWIRQGKVPVLAPTEGSRGVRLSERTLEELQHVKPVTWDGERFLRQHGGHPAAEEQHGSGSAAARQQSGGTTAARQEEPAGLPAARFYEEILAGVERERDQALREVDHLRATVERQAEQITHHAIAEEQLRVMLLKLEATNAAMTGALVQKALPPAPEVGDRSAATPGARRARWWQRWR